MSLLAGNSNIVRIPDPTLKSIKIILEIIKETLKQKKFNLIKRSNQFIYYDKSENFTKKLLMYMFDKGLDEHNISKIYWKQNKKKKKF